MSLTLRRFAGAFCALALGLATASAALAVDTPPPAGSPLAKIQRGMPEDQVADLLGSPSSTNHYPTGKQWIPGYDWWGGDAYRTEWIYKGKGRVVFNKKPFSSRMRVIRVLYDPSEDGY
jgi:hypothetical protein